MAGCRWGTSFVYDRRKGMRTINKKNLQGDEEVAWYVDRCGLDPKRVLDKGNRAFGQYGPAALMGINAYVSMYEHARQLGLRLFFVVTNPTWTRLLESIVKHRHDDGSFDYFAVFEECKSKKGRWADDDGRG
jgi:hypothetical protein